MTTGLFKKLHFLLSISILFFSVHTSAQQNNFSFNHFSVKDGLAHGIVNAICQDKEGFMWIGTFNGLNRFDGSNFKIFRTDRRNPHSLANNVVHDVCVDKEDNIWCFNDGGISRYNKRTDSFDNFELRDDSTGNLVQLGEGTILCDRQGVIWCAFGGGLSEFIPSKNAFKNYRHYERDSTSLSENRIRKHSMVEDPTRHGLWIGSAKGINYFDTKTKIAYHYRNNPDHLSVFSDHRSFPVCMTNDKRLVYGDNKAFELCFYDIKNDSVTRTKKISQENRNHANDETATIFCDSRNNLWIGTWSYLFYFLNGQTGEVTEVIHDDADPKSINSQFCWDVFEDKEGTIWFGGVSGISYFNPQKTIYRLYRPDLIFPLLKKHSIIYCLHEDENNLLWFGTFGAGLFSYDFSTNTYNNYSYEKNSGLKAELNNTIFSIEVVGKEWWLGTHKGIRIFDPVAKTFRKFNGIPEKEKVNDFYALFLTNENDRAIWFSSNNGHIYRYDLKTNEYQAWSEVTVDSTKVSLEYVNAISKDSQNRIWISAYEKGLLQYLPEKNTFKIYPAAETDTNRLPAPAVIKITDDGSGNIWAAVRGQGFSRLNPETGMAKTWNSSDGLGFNLITAMATDHLGRLWIAGYNLVTVFDPASGHFENFTIEFAESNYNYLNCMLTLENGKIVNSMLGAFVLFDPEQQSKSISRQNVLISRFSIFGKEAPFTMSNPNLELSYKQNYFSFDYSVCTGVDRNKIEYSYILEGFDKGWVEAGARQYAAYTNVPGGDYVFRVRARSGNEPWTEHASVINIHISKIYYQTWWFRFLVALLMFLTIRVYVRFRKNQQRKVEAEQAIAYFANSEYTNHSADEIVWDLARNCISRLGFVDCVIYLTDEDRQVLVQKAVLGDKSGDEKTILNPLEIPIGKGIVGSAAATGKTELVEDTSKDSRYITDVVPRHSEIAVPIIHDGKVIGVIDSEHHRKSFFNREHRRILETIASICAAKIVNAQAAQQLEENEKKLLEVDKRVAEVRLMALRAQMNPHFIFNCLNAIDNYVLKNDVEVASKYLNKFARLIRSILSVSDKNFISLRTEMDLLNNYVELENLRFHEKFKYELLIDEKINADETDVPSMLIQPFIENAIIHGLIHKKGEKKLFISLSLLDHSLQCIIEDNGIGRMEAQRIKNSKAQTHESKGMKVTEGRLELLQQQVKDKGIVKVTDVVDADGNPAGTRVEILIPIDI